MGETKTSLGGVLANLLAMVGTLISLVPWSLMCFVFLAASTSRWNPAGERGVALGMLATAAIPSLASMVVAGFGIRRARRGGEGALAGSLLFAGGAVLLCLLPWILMLLGVSWLQLIGVRSST